MVGRNDVAIDVALEAMAQALQNQPNTDENSGSRCLATFQRDNPPTIKGTNDPDGALTWLKEIERIFHMMDCTPAQKVRYGTHMLVVEADDWWLETRQRLEVSGEDITWVVFCRKYYSEDVHGKREIEFLELMQGNMSVSEYAAKFVKLTKLYSHYSVVTAEFSKCIKFENGLCSYIKKAVGYQKIRVFADLVDSCRIYEEDNNAHYKIVNERRGKHQQNCGKPYDALAGKGKQKVANGKRTSGGDAPVGVVCFKYGKPGHKSTVCAVKVNRGFRCGKTGHAISECKHKKMVYFNCGEEGYIGSQFQKPKQAQAGGKVFALAGTQTANEDRLIRGTCFINSILLITIIDTGATHYFIDVDCVERSSLTLSSMNGEMVVDTPGMNWLEYNDVHIN
ncbi:uncharacterized protein LOC131604317 [Vicia villosa]|uniref:uncharacterized protein LOC131604317 n=1 Tax=Vicia villosa TaxID=3911 RepID=UPI00273ABDE5|nr:uncharacterized protein LOC131604317 [Vicia villosa]